jgi:hypothetical protein
MDNRHERIRLLSRIGRRRTAIPLFLTSLSEALGETVVESALVPPLDADAVVEAYRNGYQSVAKRDAVTYRRHFLRSERSVVFRAADSFGKKLSTEDVFFISKLGADHGVVKLNISVLLKHAESIIQLDGDSLSALSIDHSQGVLIDHNRDECEEAYEIAAWGNRWPLLMLACDPG